MLGLWDHECQRVFSDKMITLEDKAWVDGAIKELCKSTFAPDLTKQVSPAEDSLYTITAAWIFIARPIISSHE